MSCHLFTVDADGLWLYARAQLGDSLQQVRGTIVLQVSAL